MSNIMDKITERFRVKVYKNRADDRTSLCGEKIIHPGTPLHDGDTKGAYFVIPANHADFINTTYRHYSISEPYIPGIDDAKNLPKQAKPEPVKVNGFTCKHLGHGKWSILNPQGEMFEAGLSEEDAKAKTAALNLG